VVAVTAPVGAAVLLIVAAALDEGAGATGAAAAKTVTLPVSGRVIASHLRLDAFLTGTAAESAA